MPRLSFFKLLLATVLLLSACATPMTSAAPQRLRRSTTTSIYDSGLLDAILQDFESKYSAKVDVVAVGTGQALELGVHGGDDVVLIHACSKEDQFVADGDGVNPAAVLSVVGAVVVWRVR